MKICMSLSTGCETLRMVLASLVRCSEERGIQDGVALAGLVVGAVDEREGLGGARDGGSIDGTYGM
jgi:hypothetical protein